MDDQAHGERVKVLQGQLDDLLAGISEAGRRYPRGDAAAPSYLALMHAYDAVAAAGEWLTVAALRVRIEHAHQGDIPHQALLNTTIESEAAPG